MIDPDDINFKQYALNTTCVGEVFWDASPPSGISFQTHKFMLLDSVERASVMLRTDPGVRREQLIAGFNFASILAVLPQFVVARSVTGEMAGLLPRQNGHTLLGTVGRREVLLDTAKWMDDLAFLTNGTADLVWLKVLNLK